MRRRKTDHRTCTSGSKRVGRRRHRCSGSDDVIHEQHRPRPHPPKRRDPHLEARADPPLHVRTPGLRWAWQPSQQFWTRQAEACGKAPSQHLGLIETTGTRTHCSGRRPRDSGRRIVLVHQARHALGKPVE